MNFRLISNNENNIKLKFFNWLKLKFSLIQLLIYNECNRDLIKIDGKESALIFNFNNSLTIENNRKIKVLINIDETESAFLLIQYHLLRRNQLFEDRQRIINF